MIIDRNTHVGQIATQHPLATRVFHRHGIDFCCRGATSIAEVCTDQALSLDRLLQEIEDEISESGGPQDRWDQAPLPALIDHILSTHHQFLRDELPRINEMAIKVHRVHGSRGNPGLKSIVKVFEEMRAELESHMQKEEIVLFPMIREGNGAMAAGPVTMMEHEHRAAGDALARLRTLTDEYQVPDGACATWRALWHGLEALEKDLHQHIHLENNILFPRALASG